jgi:hypothetical protein
MTRLRARLLSYVLVVACAVGGAWACGARSGLGLVDATAPISDAAPGRDVGRADSTEPAEATTDTTVPVDASCPSAHADAASLATLSE